MTLSYHRVWRQSVTILVLLIAKTSDSKSVPRAVGDSDLSSEVDHSDIARSRILGGNSFQSDSIFEIPNGNWIARQEAPESSTHRFSTSRNLPTTFDNAQTLGLTNVFSNWLQVPEINLDKLPESSHDQNSIIESFVPSSLQSFPRETLEQGVGQRRRGENGTLEERLEAGLARVEANIEGLVAGFLQLQRSVFNLEQLQELLVLLLEDILKETGIINDSPRPGRGPERNGRRYGDDEPSSGRMSGADERESHDSGSMEDNVDEERQEHSDEDVSKSVSQRKDGKTTRDEGGEVSHTNKGHNPHNSVHDTHHTDTVHDAEVLSKNLHESVGWIQRGEHGPVPQNNMPRKQQNVPNSDEDDLQIEGSESQESEEDTSEENESEVDNYTPDPTFAAITTTDTTLTTEMDRQLWAERLVGLSNERSTQLNRDMLQNRLRARFDNLVQEVAARLSNSLLAARSNQLTNAQSRSGNINRSRAGTSHDLPEFHVFDPSARSAEDFEGFSDFTMSNNQHNPSRRFESGLTRPSQWNDHGPESPHEPPPLMLFEPLLISPDAGDRVDPSSRTNIADSEQTLPTVDIILRRRQTNPSITGHGDEARTGMIDSHTNSFPRNQKATQGDNLPVGRALQPTKESNRSRHNQPDTLQMVSSEASALTGAAPETANSARLIVTSSTDDAEKTNEASPTDFTILNSDYTHQLTPVSIKPHSEKAVTTEDFDYDFAIGKLLRDLSARLNRHHIERQRRNDEEQMNTPVIGGDFQTNNTSVGAGPVSSDSSSDFTSRVLTELDKLIWLSQPGMDIKFKPVYSDSVPNTAPIMNTHELVPTFGETRKSEHPIKISKVPKSLTENAPINRETNNPAGENKTFTVNSTRALENSELSKEWEWLREILNASFSEESLDWDELLVGLAQMTQITGLAEDLKSISERGSKLIEKRIENDKLDEKIDNERDVSSLEFMNLVTGNESSAENETEGNVNFTHDEVNRTTHDDNSDLRENIEETDESYDNEEADAGYDVPESDDVDDEDIYDENDDVDNDGDIDNSSEIYDETFDNADQVDDSFMRFKTKYQKKTFNNLKDSKKEKAQNANTFGRASAEVLLTNFPTSDKEDLITYENIYNNQEQGSTSPLENLETLLRQSLEMASTFASHEPAQTSNTGVWSRKRRSTWRSTMKRRENQVTKNNNLKLHGLLRQKRQALFSGPGLGHNQFLDFPAHDRSFHSQHSINAVHQQDQLLPKTPVNSNVQNENLFNTLMSSLLDTMTTTHNISNAIGDPLKPQSNTASPINIYSVPHNQQHERVSNTGLAPPNPKANPSFNQIFGTIFPAVNENQYPMLSRAQNSRVNPQQRPSLPFGEPTANHVSWSKPSLSQKRYDVFANQYSNTYQNPQINQFPNYNTNRNNNKNINNNNNFDMNKFSPSFGGSFPHQGSTYSHGSPAQTPHRNTPPHGIQPHYPIGGYSHYMNQLGIHFPDVGFIGGPGIFGNPAEPGELPSFEAEEILTNIFKQYWQRLNRMYNPPGPSTTTTMEPGEYEGEITTTPATTTTTRTTTAKAMPTTPAHPSTTTMTAKPTLLSLLTSPVIFGATNMSSPDTTTPLAATSAPKNLLPSVLPTTKGENQSRISLFQASTARSSLPLMTTTPIAVEAGRGSTPLAITSKLTTSPNLLSIAAASYPKQEQAKQNQTF